MTLRDVSTNATPAFQGLVGQNNLLPPWNIANASLKAPVSAVNVILHTT